MEAKLAKLQMDKETEEERVKRANEVEASLKEELRRKEEELERLKAEQKKKRCVLL